jgi:PKD repeat protein
MIGEPHKSYTVSLTCTGDGGTTQTSKGVTVYSPAVAEFSLAPAHTDLAAAEMKEVDFMHNSVFADKFNWSFGDNTLSEKPSPSHIYNNSPDEKQVYKVKLTAKNNGGDSCADSLIKPVCVPSRPIIDIPFGGYVSADYVPQIRVNMNHNCLANDDIEHIDDFAYEDTVILFYRKSGNSQWSGFIECLITPSGYYSCDEFRENISFEGNVAYDLKARASNGLISKDSSDTSFTFESRPWYQIEGGGVHADKGTISSEIPSLDKYFFKTPVQGFATRNSIFAMYFGRFSGNIGQAVYANSGSFRGRELKYDYWWEKFESIFSDPWNGVAPPSGSEFVVYATSKTQSNKPDSPLELGEWALSGVKAAIIHHGDIEIVGDININNGALMVVVSGNITIKENVSRVDGFYFADGKIISSGNTNLENYPEQLKLQGGFIGWGGVELLRNLGPEKNHETPAEIFMYRKDIVDALRGIDILKVFTYQWREVEP